MSPFACTNEGLMILAVVFSGIGIVVGAIVSSVVRYVWEKE